MLQDPRSGIVIASDSGGAYPLLKVWRKALARARNNNGRGRVIMIGDSKTRGAHAGATYATSPAAQLAKILGGRDSSIKFTSDCIPGVNNMRAATPSWDTRFVVGGAWHEWSPSSIKYGVASSWTATSSGTIAYTPTNAFDRADIWYPQGSGAGTMTVDIAGTGTATLNANTAAPLGAFPKATIVRTDGGGAVASGTINAIWASGQPFLSLVDPYNSTVSDISIVNAGMDSLTSSAWSDEAFAFSNIPAIQALVPDLVIMTWVNNDALAVTGEPALDANVRKQINRFQSAGADVLLILASQMATSACPLSRQLSYRNVLYRIAADNPTVAFIDYALRYGTYEQMTADGLTNNDGAHENALGYSDEMNLIARFLLAA